MASQDGFRERVLGERVAAEGRTFRILEREVEIQPGRVATFELVDKGDSVAVVAVDDGGDVHLVEEYFAAIDRRCLCLPKGRIDPGEDPVDAAMRELAEEVGVHGTAQQLGVLDVSPGYLRQRTWLFLVRGLSPFVRPGDEAHYLQVVRMPMAEALSRCADGGISEARTVAGLFLAVARLEQNSR